MMSFPQTRMRRLRQNKKLRELLQETKLSVNDLIQPLFLHHQKEWYQEIPSMPGQYQMGLVALEKELLILQEKGIKGVILFGIPGTKDLQGSESYSDQGIIAQGIALAKRVAPELLIIADVCLCEYTSHGHCGIVHQQDVDNDQTLPLLQKQAICFAKAGVDMLAPSGMMDGKVQAIRQALDANNFSHLPIMSYSVKYASALYGPFRAAADFSLEFGSRETYQINPGQVSEALREVELDIDEGADILMVKPTGFYLDIIQRLHQEYPQLPMAAYQVSGEYSMIKAAVEKGWLTEKAIVLESLLAIKRAGAKLIISYFSKQVATWLAEEG